MTRARALRALAALASLALLLTVALGWTFVRRPLPVPTDPLARLPAVSVSAPVGLGLLPSAEVETRHGLSVRGASLGADLVSAMVAFVVEHPEGRLLIDAGMGRRGREHVSTIPLMMQPFIDLQLSQSTVDGLAAHHVGPDDLHGVLLTHAHWDHVSGLEELPGVPVYMSAEELRVARSGEGDALFQIIDAAAPVDVHVLELDDGPYGPFEASHDFYGDGSVIAVPMPGHTDGSLGIFVNLPSGSRYLFIGDTAWARESVDWPAEKPWLARRIVDGDAAGVREQLVLLHQLQEQNPQLIIVPAHDARVHAQIATWPRLER